MSRKKVLNAILLALSVLLSAMQGLEGKDESNSPSSIEKIE